MISDVNEWQRFPDQGTIIMKAIDNGVDHSRRSISEVLGQHHGDFQRRPGQQRADRADDAGPGAEESGG
jgi:hypothetical protein